MKGVLLLAAVGLMAPLPALSQSSRPDDDHDGYGRGEERLLRMMRDMHDEDGAGRGRGAAFFLRSGDATVGVRCDPRDSMRSCVDSTLTLLDRARSLLPSGGTTTSPGAPSTPRP